MTTSSAPKPEFTDEDSRDMAMLLVSQFSQVDQPVVVLIDSRFGDSMIVVGYASQKFLTEAACHIINQLSPLSRTVIAEMITKGVFDERDKEGSK